MSSCCTLGCTMLLLSALPASALPTQQLQLPTFVSSHMALQRQPHHARLWGWTAPGRTVTVTLDNNYSSPVRGVANASGSWQVDLPPQPAGAGHTIAISDGNASSTRTLVDVAFGDIYLCSGQSNMEFSVNGAFNASSEIADSINYPNLRLATVRKAVADSPVVHAKSKANYSWARSGPAAMVGAAGPQFSYFSATCYFFGREVYKALGGKVPIGLVASDWGGQRVECFSSADALADTTCGGTRPAGSRYSTYCSCVASWLSKSEFLKIFFTLISDSPSKPGGLAGMPNSGCTGSSKVSIGGAKYSSMLIFFSATALCMLSFTSESCPPSIA